MNIPDHILITLTADQKAKIESAQSPEDLLALAKEAGYELSPDQLEAVSGGEFCDWWCGTFKPCYKHTFI